MKMPQSGGTHSDERKVRNDIPEVRDPPQRALIGKLMVFLILWNGRKQKQRQERGDDQAKKISTRRRNSTLMKAIILFQRMIFRLTIAPGGI